MVIFIIIIFMAIMAIFMITNVNIIVMNNHDFSTFVPRGDTTGPGDDLSQYRPSSCFVYNFDHYDDDLDDDGHADMIMVMIMVRS